jgi:hypothetical protein
MLTKVQKSTSIINLVQSWVQMAYSDLIEAEQDLSAQQVKVEMENARFKEDAWGGGFGPYTAPTTEFQEKRAQEKRNELSRRQEIYAFTIEKFLKEESEL